MCSADPSLNLIETMQIEIPTACNRCNVCVNYRKWKTEQSFNIDTPHTETSQIQNALPSTENVTNDLIVDLNINF